MSAEITELVQQAGPYLTAALGTYGHNVLTHAETAAADATAKLGRQLLRAIWHRRSPEGRSALEAVVQNAVENGEDPDTLAALRLQIKRALREDPDLRDELVRLLNASTPPVSITASGEGQVVGGNVHMHAEGGSVTALKTGNVTIAAAADPRRPGPAQG